MHLTDRSGPRNHNLGVVTVASIFCWLGGLRPRAKRRFNSTDFVPGDSADPSIESKPDENP